MKNVTAIISLLHEPPHQHSGERLFRSTPVLGWTLDRLGRTNSLEKTAILCWEDQARAILPLAAASRAEALIKGPRVNIPEVEAIAVARRWADGWRGGLLSSCSSDVGFYGPWFLEIAQKLQSDAVMPIDPASALVDPEMVDRLIELAAAQPDHEFCFAPAPPGLALTLVRRGLLERLAAGRVHPGRLLHYHPDQISREPLAADNCLRLPARVTRSTARLTLHNDAQVERITDAAVSLNGQLIKTHAEDLVARVESFDSRQTQLRAATVDITARRNSQPIFLPASSATSTQSDMTLEHAKRLFDQLGRVDGLRLTLGCVGDPLLSPQFGEILEAAAQAGIASIHVQTDLLGDPDSAAMLAQMPIDVVSVHLPAVTPPTYQALMGVDGYGRVLENIKSFVTARWQRQRGVPVLAPLFLKCQANLAEMEAWYDQWLRAVGSAVITGPSDFAGQIADVAAADMAPPRRRPCNRLGSRLTVLCSGQVTRCEQDFLGKEAVGHIEQSPIINLWTDSLSAVRAQHERSEWSASPLCAACREWHRP